MPINFTKMHGLSNDFVIINAINQPLTLTSAIVQQLGNRHTGIGFDQLLLLQTAQDKQSDFHYQVFNADGSIAQQCGNGARCLARFIADNQLTNKKHFMASTDFGCYEMIIEDDEEVSINMQAPIFAPKKIPADLEPPVDLQKSIYHLATQSGDFQACILSMGNPHCVLRLKSITNAEIEPIGSSISTDKRFPEQTNVGFMQIINTNMMKLRVYERGVGETQACGSGACAAVVAARLQHLVDETVQIQMPGGSLTISWQGDDQNHNIPVWMKGPAIAVFHGTVSI